MDNQLKRTTSFILLMFLTSFTFAQESLKETDFNSIDLSEMRRSIQNEMLKDGLIKSKKDRIHLHLRTEVTELNGEKLNQDLHEKYNLISKELGIGRGSFRTVLISKKCTAVGDVYEDGFKGKMEGKLRIQEIKISGI